MRRSVAVLGLVGLVTTACSASATGPGQSAATAAPATLRTVRDIPLQGNTSRWDYQSFDPQAHRLYLAHLGDGTVAVYDTRSGAVMGEIRDVPGVHGVIAVPEVGKVYATATDSNQPPVRFERDAVRVPEPQATPSRSLPLGCSAGRHLCF